MNTQNTTADAAATNSRKATAIESLDITKHDLKIAFAVVGALIECGSIPLPDLRKEGWHNHFAIAVMTAAGALAVAGVSS